MKKGFTLVELLMVIVVMAMIATLSTGAAMNAIQQARKKKIAATCVTLKMALTNYRAAEGRWPADLADADEKSEKSDKAAFKGENNKLVFGPLLDPLKPYLDPSALLTKTVNNGVLSVREAMEISRGKVDFPLGFPDPKGKGVFKYFKVTFNMSLDTVNVEAPD